jgi:hypothetical protein
MKANELRIGNWVKINDDYFEDGKEIGYDLYKTNEFQIMGFNDGSFIEGCKVICFYEIPSEIGGWVHGGCSDLDIDPIPLTEEWLLKFGGILDYEDNSYIFGNFAVSVNKKSEAIMFFKDEQIAEFNYLHQLQNLYFALTGEEIVIKE